ncbi:hypothetical protein TNCV_4552251 [Trichonephila clavipes]|nr:hypothetical protein TNCV_4552251 [Trichonephila clavipes]
MLERRIAARPRLPATVRDLEIALLEEWNSIPQSLIDNLIASMANRFKMNGISPLHEIQNAQDSIKASKRQEPNTVSMGRRNASRSSFPMMSSDRYMK